MINLKKLVYQYRYLKLDLDELKEQHSELATEFEEEFSNNLDKGSDEEIEVPNPKKETKPKHTDASVKDIYKKVGKAIRELF